ncbi:MAG: phosphate ABC transporter substrate-binding protein [Nitrospira sp.]|nr:phosphate ABC transporter substrate-binding protein [Candidatus Manganitrophaceae bacterium]HIL33920.1 phosphate ABC transporter substrate-binding protein [Candidatus Manganitrophaceae bacterium]
MKRVSVALLSVVAFGGLFFSAQSFTPMDSPGTPPESHKKMQLILTGSSTVAPLAAEMGKEFEKKYPGVRVDVQTGGSSRGIADARLGLADIGMVSRPLNKDETDLFAFTIAQDGISMILHADNPIERLSRTDIVNIYTGRIKNWKTLGGRDAPITVVNKAAGRSTLELFTAFLKISNHDIQVDVVIGDNAQGIKTVAGNINAVGYVSVGAAEYDAADGVSIKLIPISNGVTAMKTNPQEGTLLTRPLNLVTTSAPEGIVAAFIDFAQSTEVDPIIKEQYLVPVTQ